jgi:peptidyl-prolyl cis-trans isomerase D
MFRMKDKALGGLDGDKLNKNFWTYAVLLSALGAMTFFGVCDPTGAKFGRGGGGSVAAKVGGEKISRVEFQRAYQRAYSQYQRIYQDAFDPGQLRLAHTVLRELVDERALYLKAEALGLRASDDEIVQLLTHEDAFRGEDGKFSDEVFKRYLDSNGYTESAFLEDIRRSVTVQKLRRFVADSSFVSQKAAELDYSMTETTLDLSFLKFDPQKMDVAVAPGEVDKFLADASSKARVKEYYEKNPAEFNRPEQVKARHILVSFKGARNATADAEKREKDAARKLAEDLLQEVRTPGTDFVVVATRATDEPSGKTSGGDLGWFGREAMDKAFSDAAFTIEKGQISGIVESPFGFHIIRVEDKKSELKQTLEAAERQIAENLLLKERRPLIAKEAADKVFADLKAGQPVDQLLAQYHLQWGSTGEVHADARYLPGIGASSDVGDALVGLRQPGELFPRVLDVRGNFYVLKLKQRKEPDLSKLTGEKRKQLAETAALQEGSQVFTQLAKKVEADLEKNATVWLNPEFLALDDTKSGDRNGG